MMSVHPKYQVASAGVEPLNQFADHKTKLGNY